jgi:predicted transcriptional regulator
MISDSVPPAMSTLISAECEDAVIERPLENGKEFVPDHEILVRIMDPLWNPVSMELRWTHLLNHSRLNSRIFRRYITYCVFKEYVIINELGNGHRSIKIRKKGIKFLKDVKKHLGRMRIVDQ